MKCPKCGREFPDDINFCNECGTKLVKNGNFIDEWKGWSTSKQILSLVGACCVILIVIGAISSFLTPEKEDTTVINNTSHNVTIGDYSNSVSSSSDGYDTYYSYEDEYGSGDLKGTVYSDGSIEAHQKGTTEFGDYEVNSYMDSDGNIHGTVTTGGYTYYV